MNSNKNVTATFAINQYTVSATPETNGTLDVTTPSPVNVNYGATTSFKFNAATGYYISGASGCGGTPYSNSNQSVTTYTYTTGTTTGVCTANATFAVKTFNVSFQSGGHGTLTGTTSQTVNYGASATTVTAVPDTDYHFVNWTGTGGFVTTTANPLTVTNILANQTITAIFAHDPVNGTCGSSNGSTLTAIPTANLCNSGTASTVTETGPWNWYCYGQYTGNFAACSASIQTYTIMFASGGNGTLTGTTGQSVKHGRSTTAVTAVPANGYHFVNWTGTGSFVTSTSNPLTISNVTETQVITANFTVNTYSVSFASGGNGTLTGATSQTINHGSSATAVTAVPVTGYHFVNWTGTGGFVTTTDNPLTVTNVTAAKAITANFAIDTFAVSFASGGNGTLSGTASQTVNYGESASAVTAVPATGYHFVNWTGTGGFVTTTANPLTVTNVTVAQTITANFDINTYSVTFASGGNGALSGTTSQMINHGANATTVTAVPSTGYHFVNWKESATEVSTNAALSITNITTAHSYTATFAINTYNVNFAANGNGTLTGTANQTINYDASTTTVTAVPATGHHFINWTEGATEVSTNTALTVNNVTAAHNYSANFAIDTFAVTFASGGNGSLSGTNSQTINYNSSASAITAVPDSDYYLVNWTGDGGFVTTSANPLIVANITKPLNINANFARIPIPGICGSSNSKTSKTDPTTNLCLPDAAVALSETATGWSWGCPGSYEGTTANCSSIKDINGPVLIVSNLAFPLITDKTSMNITGTVSDISGIDSLTINSTPVTVTNGNFSYPVTLQAGNNEFALIATDTLGNQTTETRAIILDTTNPALTVSTLANGTLTGNNTLNISGTVTDANGVDSLSINNTPVTVKTDNTFSHALTLLTGDNMVTITATDLAGNQTIDERTIKYDGAAPKLTINSPADNSKTSQVLSTITGTVDETSIVVIKSVLNGSQNAAMDGNNFSATVNLESGINTVDITATDLVENSSGAKLSITYDPLKPTLAVTAPGCDVTIYTDRITITGTADGTLSGIADLVITADGKEYRPAVTSGNFSQEVTFSEEKLNPVTVSVTDEAGNSESITRNVIFVKGAISINNGALYTTSATASLRLGYYPSATKMQFLYAASWTAWENFAATKAITLPTGNGLKTVSVRFQDAAGNISAIYSATINYDTTKPLVTTFTVKTPTSSLIVPITSLVASDASGISGYLVTATSTVPLATATGWTADPPGGYTFTTVGSKTLYAWARDKAGMVSLAKTATAVIDQIKPVISAFTLKNPSGRQIAITALTASDNVAVTGYLISESADIPGLADARWSAVKPLSYAVSTSGTYTLYAWVRDGAGNISLSRSATTTADAVLPTVTSFIVPPLVKTLTIPVTAFTATDNNAVTGYIITSSATAPLATATTWKTIAPLTFAVTSAGDKTLYAWVKDGAGNVSTAAIAKVTADNVKPTLSAFTLQATSTSTTVPITTLTATDNIGVTGYLFTLTSTAPTLATEGWTAEKPASYTFNGLTSGVTTQKTIYVWVKDYAGNISSSRNSKSTITLPPDSIAPVIETFTIPATAESLTVAVTLSATDTVGISGYLLNETGTTPTPTTAGWTASKTSYTFTSAGAKTLYAFAKDAGGNISARATATTAITLPPDFVAPVIGTFSIPATASSLTVAVTFNASDANGVTGYLLNETGTTPTAEDVSWAVSKTNYAFSSPGAKALYAWAKDASGNISEVRSATTTITLPPDTTRPAISAFTLKSTSTSATVPVTTLTATDNVGITGYLFTLTSSTPTLATAGWTAEKPTSYTFSGLTSGVSAQKILYLWVRDYAGNISSSRNSRTTITLPSD